MPPVSVTSTELKTDSAQAKTETCTQTQITEAPYYFSLTSLRFPFAMMIVVRHMIGLELFGDKLASFSNIGSIGLQYFLVLSGFLLASKYLDFSSAKSLISYTGSRIARVAPIYFVSLGFCILLLPITSHVADSSQAIPSFFASLLCIQSWIPDPSYYFGYNAPAWTINTDVLFYAIFPFIVLTNRIPVWLKLAAVSLASLLIAVVVNTAFPTVIPKLYTSVCPLSRLMDCVIGVAALHIACHFRQRINASRSRWGSTTLELLAIAMLVGWTFWGDNYCANAVATSTLPPGVASWMKLHAIALIMSFLLISMSFQRGVISQLLSARWAVYLGELTAAIYLTHNSILLYYKFNPDKFPTLPGPILAVGLIGTILLVAFLLYEFVEKPARRRIRAIFDAKAER